MTTASTYETLCRLLAAWVHKTALEPAETPDFQALYQAADRHFLSAAACAALEQTGLMDACPPQTARRFRDARAAALRRTILMDAEREALLAFLEEQGIWYAPLKGVVVNGVYPQFGVRQFADNDILFDETRWQDVQRWMEGRGYTAQSLNEGAHDVYQKPPIYDFEMHRVLFADDGIEGFSDACAVYYGDVKARLLRDPDRRFGYHLSDEDFFVFLVAHAYKHYAVSGTGLRTLLDLYLYERARPAMDGAYIAGQLQRLGVDGFGAVWRSLAGKLFGPAPCPALTDEEREMLAWVESSGVYGNTANLIYRKMQDLQGDGGAVTVRTRVRYLLRRVFPPWDWYERNVPFVYRHRWFAPFYWVVRLCRGVVLRGRRYLREAGLVFARREQ